jgi:peptidoglycan hydrolase-like protein with peptidoglycan-binding domain
MTRGRMVAAAVAGIAVCGGAAAFSLAADGGSAAQGSDHAVPTATAKIVRQDLVDRDSESGKLGYSDQRTLIAPLKGTVTWRASAGSTIQVDHRILQVDGKDVYLLDGDVPAWRTLAPGTDGDDVLQLERNLRHLGFDEDHDMEVDGDWDDGTTAAVERWQDRKGLDETGTIPLGQIVFQPGARRIAGGGAEVGAPAGGGALTTTSTRKIVTVAMPTSKATLAHEGDRVQVELPSNKVVDGRVSEIGRVATTASKGDSSDANATIEVTVRMTGKADASALDQAPVTVDFEKSRAKAVLTVPVTALIARPGGRFAVEVQDGGQLRLVAVTVGLYTDSYVEISGAGLREGMLVSDGRV